MTSEVDIVNRALQTIGTRTTVTSLAEQSNEAVQASMVLTGVRDELLRMAPWNCGTNTANLVYITSAPGTPENSSSPLTTWQKGIPPPPWAYEYQYPVDCIKPLWIIPQYSTGFSGGVPITTAVTGGVASFWSGPPVRYKVAVDQFFTVGPLTSIITPGTGYVPGEIVTLVTGPVTGPPMGAPAQVRVLTVDGAGGVLTAEMVPTVPNDDENISGSYFSNNMSFDQGSTTGVGTGLAFAADVVGPGDQRVILTSEEFAILTYVKRVIDPNIMDEQFVQAWIAALGARLTFALVGDKSLANMKIQEANSFVMEARKSDGNEGLTVNNVTPDWIRMRGIAYPVDFGWAPNQTYDWGPVFSMY